MFGQILFNFHDVILLVTVYQCLVLALLFALARHQTATSKLFAVGFFILMAVVPLDVLIIFGAGFREFAIEHLPNWFYVFEFGYWLQGPFLLWYVRSVVYKDFRLRGSDLLYVAPFLLYFTHQLLVYHSLDTQIKVHIQVVYDLFKESYTVVFVVFARELLRFYFGALALLEFNSYLKSLRNKNLLYIDQGLFWLKFILHSMFILWGISVVISLCVVLNVTHELNLPVENLGLFNNYLTCLVLGATLISISMGSLSVESIEKIANLKPKKIPDTINPKHIAELEQLMLEKKPYLDADLSPESLAKLINLSPRLVSNVINQHFGCNFFAFINRYRIENAKQLLSDLGSQDKSVLEIMYQVGFNSKATFNLIFKKMEGITPREYRKLHLGDTDSDHLEEENFARRLLKKRDLVEILLPVESLPALPL